jgi:acetolactate synthase-1/2/3 large subunit
MINRSEKPIILCGHGVIASNAGPVAADALRKRPISRWPLPCTAFRRMPMDHPLSLGMVGMHGTVEANRALLNADLIISFGMRFDDRVTGNLEPFAVNAEVIHVEIDPSEIDKNVKTSVAINADTAEVLTLLARDPELTSKPRQRWFDQIDAYRREIAAAIQRRSPPGWAGKGQLLMKTITNSPDITQGQRYHRQRCGAAPDDPGPLLQFPDHQQLVYLRGRRHHGLRPAHGGRREAGPAG